ncbi:MAG TPA: hypothetical protein VGQ83_40975 [Polyangia bacterium]
MKTTGDKVQGAIDGTKKAAHAVIDKAKALAHKVGDKVEKGANEVANVAGQTLETVGHQMKDTTTKTTPAKK